jgi:aspartate kinase
MPIVVQKYGGTSVGDPERITRVADRIVRARERGQDVVAVVSAMGHTTDELVGMAAAITPAPEPRELDMLLTAGERIAMSLLAIAVNARGCRAASYTGSQAGIITDTHHGKAKIVEIRPARIKESLEAGNVVILAGFQGLSTEYDITTLGRGGSDTTAVALAAALGADACEIYTDVDGVFTADPRIVPGARKLHAVSYEEMLEMSASGARVLSLRSVEFARNHSVKLHVRSTFTDEDGTWIREEDERMLEKAMISGVTHTLEEAVYEVKDADRADLFQALAEAAVNVDTIIEASREIVFSAPAEDRNETTAALERLGAQWTAREGLGKVSVIGAGMKSHPGVAARTFSALRELGVEPQLVATSPIKIAFYVPQDEVERTVKALHEAFELSSASAERQHA